MTNFVREEVLKKFVVQKSVLNVQQKCRFDGIFWSRLVPNWANFGISKNYSNANLIQSAIVVDVVVVVMVMKEQMNRAIFLQFNSQTSQRRFGQVHQRWLWTSPSRVRVRPLACRPPFEVSGLTSRRIQRELRPVR